MARPPTRTVLVVEDDQETRAMLTTLFEVSGLGVVTASNGREAYDLARQHDPSVILLDLMMPVMSGEEFRTAQLADADIRRIPVVVVSAHHQASHIAQRMKAAGCLMKPVDFDVLLDMVQHIVDGQEGEGRDSEAVHGVN